MEGIVEHPKMNAERAFGMRITILFSVLISFSGFCQEIDNSSTLFDVRDSSFTRISYDNDIFRGTDRWYTQGIGIDVFSSKLEKNPLNIVLLHLKDSDNNRFGIQFRTHGCTPSTILSDTVLIGDRPYAGVFSFGMVRSSEWMGRKLRMTSSFELGMIGPAAVGEQTQTGIHTLTGSDLPLGWGTQIKNAPIVNYALRIEKGIAAVPSVFQLSGFGQVKVGTFQTNVSAGIEMCLGWRSDSFSEPKHRFECYLYSQFAGFLVGYDASLMGGIINRDGYRLAYSDLNPFVLRQHVGLVLAVPHFSITADLAFITKEIRHGSKHSWGGIRLTFY